jgi:hypothetical protein
MNINSTNMQIIKSLGLNGDAAKDICHLDIHLDPSEFPSVQIKRLVFNTETIGRVFETMELLPKGEHARMKGETAVLRGLLRESLSALETIREVEHGFDDEWELLTELKAKISAAIATNPLKEWPI